jgi:hypothetical protein
MARDKGPKGRKGPKGPLYYKAALQPLALNLSLRSFSSLRSLSSFVLLCFTQLSTLCVFLLFFFAIMEIDHHRRGYVK